MKMDLLKFLSSQPEHLEGPFLLVWTDLIKEMSAKPSFVQRLLLVEEIWIFVWLFLEWAKTGTCEAAGEAISSAKGLGGAVLGGMDSS